MTCYEELKARGLIAQVTNEEEISKMINEGKAVFYIGFDPTADSLHVGHFMALCLMKRLQTANLDRKNPLAKAALLSMRDHLDLDMAPHLSGYDRERICVPPTCDCGKTECRYLCYLDVCASERYAIQVCNHNLLLADAIHQGITI